ncbi:MAG: membrane protein [Candidatus Syntrophoarchaeum butanivorans]|uniref:Membrane protein n=1 Tax=Candidatus Syntropharchaeum butanivorans TaxID=1839936 RepID=A0A1F2P518_9EURY|nr:MAG: membrane protein [Candidatus Syntrophoarchaeum butanivorans]
MSAVLSIGMFALFLLTFVVSILAGIYYADREEVPGWVFIAVLFCILSIIFYGILEFS